MRMMTEEQLKRQIRIGTKVEMEHTNDRKQAEQIAVQHLMEFPDYYDRLLKMERQAKKDWGRDTASNPPCEDELKIKIQQDIATKASIAQDFFGDFEAVKTWFQALKNGDDAIAGLGMAIQNLEATMRRRLLK